MENLEGTKSLPHALFDTCLATDAYYERNTKSGGTSLTTHQNGCCDDCSRLSSVIVQQKATISNLK